MKSATKTFPLCIGTNEGAIVPSEEAHFKWPDLVMKFFEERLQLKKKEEEK